MEEKKSPKADLERGRLQRFLVGLVVVLASLYVALEWTFSPSDPFDDLELLAQFDADEELAPLMRPENELQLAPKHEPEPAVKLKVVDNDAEQELQQQEEAIETDQNGDMTETDEALEPPPPPSADDVSLPQAEDLPQFPGGPMEFIKWLTRNLKYPAAAQQRKVQGKVVAEFIVNKDGSVTDVRIVKSLDRQCDREALRVLRMMPRWTAGMQQGEPCRTKVCIPIVFKL